MNGTTGVRRAWMPSATPSDKWMSFAMAGAASSPLQIVVQFSVVRKSIELNHIK